MLDVCWASAETFAAICYNGRASWMFAGRLLDRVNTLLVLQSKRNAAEKNFERRHQCKNGKKL